MNLKQTAQFALTMVWNFLAIHGALTLAGVGDVRTSVRITAIVAVAALIVIVFAVRRGVEIRF